MEPRLINVNDLGRYTVVIAGHRYVPWTSLAEVPTAQQTFSELERSRWGECEMCGNGEVNASTRRMNRGLCQTRPHRIL